eukprot:TRINITY_DN3130_c0_g1_i2.p1 TRINITY_DN3130_c0_g1~~TRINITY_DN3130_c0_g1_i2.p1  ORF type:complete len:809 (+),score=227.02 TRINITY_DN3130_c0_g1_i2:156-2429(+)
MQQAAAGAKAEGKGAGKPAADKPAADKPAADKPAADKPAADKPAKAEGKAEGKGADKPAKGEKADKGEKAEKAEKGSAKAPAASAGALKGELPEFMLHRMRLWDAIRAENAAVPKPSAPIKITLPGLGSEVREGQSWRTTPFDIAKTLEEKVMKEAVAAKVNGKAWDLSRPLEGDCTLEFIFFDDKEGREVFWHSSSHILGQSLERLYGAHLCKGPAVDDGFYYDVDMEATISSDDFAVIEKMAGNVAKEKQPFERIVMTKAQALEMFKHNHFKVSIISEKVPDGETCTAYRCGPLIDLCRGPHLPNTQRVKAFGVTKNSSAYWGGHATNASLQRVYGVSFPDKEQYEEWKHLMEEAQKRDHRNIGKQQELFFFHPLSPGSCFFLPHGARIYNKLQNFIRAEYVKRGFTEVVSPNMYNTDLWKTSGHWQNYQEHMFSFDVEGQTFALKPMNCPGHCLMFDHRTRSHRELPIRLADFGVLHRNELSGALTGLTRVRRFQQDDAHIFARADQVESEIDGCLEFLQYVYGIFGFTFELHLSTRPEKKYMGELSQWEAAEKALAAALDRFTKKNSLTWQLNPGDGAFYGPKIDIKIYDALKRAHQCATIQLDFQLPIKFNLSYMAEDGAARPVMIHRAILGSVERMIAVLTEHTGGKWPFWLSPRQVIVVPVSEKFNDYAFKVQALVSQAGFYIDVDDTDRKLAKKIREAQLAQYNYILVVGQEEVEAGTANMRTRDNVVHGTFSLTDLVAEFKKIEAAFQ